MKLLYLPTTKSQQRQHEKETWVYPIHLAMEATYMRDSGHEVYWDRPDMKYKCQKVLSRPLGTPFKKLYKPDREFTKANDPKWQNNGNFKYKPGAYIMSASGCAWGKCCFCVENGKPYETRTVDDVIDEIKELKSLGYREIFDDSATFPTGAWLDEFCRKLKPIGVKFSCNMRCIDLDYAMMKDAGFRMILFGVESANQETLDAINKGIKTYDVQYVIKASLSGIEPHITGMVGYPWETHEDAQRTVKLIQELLKKGYAHTAQASFYIAPKQVSNESHRIYIPQIYRAGLYPEFWWNKLKRIRTKEDIAYIWRGIKSCFGK